MIATLALSVLLLQTPQLGNTVPERIQTAISVLGSTHQALTDKFGRPSASVESNGVWVYGPWTPSPRLGFTCAFFHEDQGARILDDGVQYIAGSVPNLNKATLTAGQSIFGDALSDADRAKGGPHDVARDFSWTSNEKTEDVLATLKADEVQHYAQQEDPKYVLTTCKVSGKPVYIFSRQIDGSAVVPVFMWDVKGGQKTMRQNFDSKKLDVYSFAVGYCSKWHYTAGFSQEELIGPGSYADTSLSDDRWIKLLAE
jgi:hypothetical protein